MHFTLLLEDFINVLVILQGASITFIVREKF